MSQRRRRFKGKTAIPEEKALPPPLKPYEVDMADAAARVYEDLFTRAKTAEDKGDPTNAICTTFRMVQEAIKVIIPRDPLNKKYALSGELSNIFRLQKGRLRICWVASSKMRRVCILFISETLRKQGDANDPYRILTKMVMSGELDEFFAEMGVRKPTHGSVVQ